MTTSHSPIVAKFTPSVNLQSSVLKLHLTLFTLYSASKMIDNISFYLLFSWSSLVLFALKNVHFHHINNTTTALYNNVVLITHLSWIIRIAIEYVYKRQHICFTSLSEEVIAACFINLHYANFICHRFSGNSSNFLFEEGM